MYGTNKSIIPCAREMKKGIVIFISIFNAFLVYSQIDKNSNTGIGTCGGTKMHYGAWGLFYNYNPIFFNKRIELNIGTGIRQSLVFGLGSKFRLYDNSKKIETFLSFNYSYQTPGKLRYDNNNSVDYYNTSATQYLHYCLTGRLWLDRFAALQVNCGYSQNISGISIQHSIGPNKNYNQVKSTLNGGMLIGADLILFVKIKSNKK